MSDQTLAFAGILQCGELVRQTATSGMCSGLAAQASVATVFRMEAPSAIDVYGGSAGSVRMGLRIAVELFSAQHEPDTLQALHYAMALGRIGRRLARDRKRQAELARELELIKPVWEDAEDGFDPSIVTQLADVYQRHVSTLDYRVTVNGKPEYLKQEEKVSQIRALLLAGLRSAFLWRQLGGRQWKLVFHRRRLLAEAEALLAA